VMGDYSHGDHQLQYGYQDLTSHASQPRVRRIFAPNITGTTASMSLSLGVDVPMPDLGTKLALSLPFTFDFPTTSARFARSFSHDLEERQSIYKSMESYIGQFTGTDGHSCLLRAMCEVGSNPYHSDGIFGDVMNVMLSASHIVGSGPQQKPTKEYTEYLEAQMDGQISGSCVKFHKDCPMSFFNLIDSVL